MKKLLVFLAFCLLGCSSNKITNSNKSNLEFVNRNTIMITADSEEYNDAHYKILLPSKFKKLISITGFGFRNEFYFNKNQIISTVYVPNTKFNTFDNLYNISYYVFVKVLEENDLDYFFEKIKLIENRKFSIIRLNDNFIIVSLNVIEKNETNYLESIKSLQFIDLNNFEACGEFLKIYDRIEIFSKGNGSISSSDFEKIQNLTGIKSESIESIDEIFAPTLENLRAWKEWFEKNKDKLYLDKFTNELKLKQ